MLGVTVENLVSTGTWQSAFVHPCCESYRFQIGFLLKVLHCHNLRIFCVWFIGNLSSSVGSLGTAIKPKVRENFFIDSVLFYIVQKHFYKSDLFLEDLLPCII